MKYSMHRSEMLRNFWVCAPKVPGGKARVYVTDDFGNLVESNDRINVSLRD